MFSNNKRHEDSSRLRNRWIDQIKVICITRRRGACAGGDDAGFPIVAAPVDAAPVDTAPVDAAPVDAAPVDTAPVDTAPVDTGGEDAVCPRVE